MRFGRGVLRYDAGRENPGYSRNTCPIETLLTINPTSE